MGNYLSFSTISTLFTCERRALYRSDQKQYIPFKRGPAMLVGKAVHVAIDAIHKEPEYDPIVEFDQAFEFEEAASEVPIDWGKLGRDSYVKDGRTIMEWYWMFNGPKAIRPVQLRSSERWFFLPIIMPDGTVEWIRGKFDQLIDYKGKLAIRELKSGKQPPNIEELARNPQIILQALAMKEGFVATGDDVPYIAITDEAYHIHDFEPIEGEPELHRCKHCQLEVRKFGRFPAIAIYYHLRGLIPYSDDLSADWICKGFDVGETEDSDLVRIDCPNCNGEVVIHHYHRFIDYRDRMNRSHLCPHCKECRFDRRQDKRLKAGFRWYYKIGFESPRMDPEFIIEFDERNIENLRRWIIQGILHYRHCQSSGSWLQTQATGWSSPCANCEYLNLCENMRLAAIRHNDDLVFDQQTAEWITPQEMKTRKGHTDEIEGMEID